MDKTILKTLVIIVVCLTIGFFAGMEYKAYQIRKALSDVFTGETQKKTEEEKIEQTTIEKNIGDTVELATIKFKINKSEERQTISNTYATPKVAKENAKFIVINLDITNITDTSFTFSNSPGFILIDDKGRQYAEYEDTIGGINNYLTMRNLSPNITENGFFVYEIPSDATSYSLNVAKAGTNEVYKVILK